VGKGGQNPIRYVNIKIMNLCGMREQNGGGTRMHCPNCGQQQDCKAIPVPKITGDPAHYNQRWHTSNINWFQRGRECLVCHHQFVTVEVDSQFLNELIELRTALGDIKANAEQYVRESTAASRSLLKLSTALSVLRALEIYKKQ
jgi:uncharacterized protein (UPF0179 family)